MAAKIKPLNAVLSYKRIAKDVGNTVTCIVFFEFVFLQHPLIKTFMWIWDACCAEKKTIHGKKNQCYSKVLPYVGGIVELRNIFL